MDFDLHGYGPADFLLRAVIEPGFFTLLLALIAKVIISTRLRTGTLRRVLGLQTQIASLDPVGIRTAKISVAYGLIPPKDVGLPYYMVEEGDTIALFTTMAILADLYGRRVLEAENHTDIQSELQDKPNLVTLSGPVWNKVTELYLGLVGSPAVFELYKNDLRIALTTTSGEAELFETTYTADHRPQSCYGLIVKSSVDMGGRAQHVVIMGGNSNLSTYAGALVLNGISERSEFRARVRKEKLWRFNSWVIIYRVENWIEGTGWYQDVPPIKVGPLRLSIERIVTAKDFQAPFHYQLIEKAPPAAATPKGEDGASPTAETAG